VAGFEDEDEDDDEDEYESHCERRVYPKEQSDYVFRQWDYASEDLLEFVSIFRPCGVPGAGALDVSWRRS
jgi:hypothetical protein